MGNTELPPPPAVSLPTVPSQVTDQLNRLVGLMHLLRQECPWDRAQTHQSLLHYLVEETGEVIDAVEQASPDEVCEELGDLLLQIVFHAEIASENAEFTLADVARGITDKLIRRHPHVFDQTGQPDDLIRSWEENKRAEKHRNSAIDGIPEALSALTRTQKVISRSRSHQVPVELDAQPITELELQAAFVNLVARAQAANLDAEATCRAGMRRLEEQIRAAEANSAV